jgi:putative phosphoesterase
VSSPLARVGVISDTHGLLRVEALHALRGVDHVVHAGDVGDPLVLDRLGVLAPLTAVRGNMDLDPWADRLPDSAEVEISGVTLHVLHVLEQLDLDPAAAGFAAVIHGHSHRPSVTERDGVLYVNPGSAGPRRFRLPVSLALIEIGANGPRARLVRLPVW